MIDDLIMKLLQEVVALTPDVPHGQVFDDGRRWCHGCMHPRPFKADHPRTEWKDRCCPACSALWPEYVEEFVQQSAMGEIDEIDLAYIH